MIVGITTEANVILTGLLKSWLRRIHGNLHNSGSFDGKKMIGHLKAFVLFDYSLEEIFFSVRAALLES